MGGSVNNDMHPIDMVLHCPKCGEQHIDAPEPHEACENEPKRPGGLWNNPPHRSHLCHGCGHIWRPADVPTNGVAAVKTKGNNDSPPVEYICETEEQGYAVEAVWQIVPELRPREDGRVLLTAEQLERLLRRAGWSAPSDARRRAEPWFPVPPAGVSISHVDEFGPVWSDGIRRELRRDATPQRIVDDAIVHVVLKDAYEIVDTLMSLATVDKPLRERVGRLLPAGYTHSFSKKPAGSEYDRFTAPAAPGSDEQIDLIFNRFLDKSEGGVDTILCTRTGFRYLAREVLRLVRGRTT